MTVYSYSRVETYKQCKYKYKLRYIDRLKVIPNQDPNNALYIGTAMHVGIEKTVNDAINDYISNYYTLNNKNIDEIIKLKYLIPKVKDIIPDGVYEYELLSDDFKGYIDLLVKNEDGTFDIYDFKYSNNVASYLESGQLHIYKYYLKKLKNIEVKNLYFVFIPKCGLRQKNNEAEYEFRKRIIKYLEVEEISIRKIEYDHTKVLKFIDNCLSIETEKDFNEKNHTRLCDWCEYKDYCMKGQDYMILPENKKRERKVNLNPDMWLYADSYVGKSTFVDGFEDLLFLNTDGNIDNTTSPVIRISNETTNTNGRIRKKLAWNVFLDIVDELEKKENTFKSICIDLVEDLYEHCRIFIYDREGWKHETDGGYGKGWDMVRTEFFTAIKRLKNLNYQIIYISKEKVEEIKYSNGVTVSKFSPNIAEKIANVLAGTVSLTVRAYMTGDDRYLQLKKKENVFGGGRFSFEVDKVRLDLKEFRKELEIAYRNTGVNIKSERHNEKSPKLEEEETTEFKEQEQAQAEEGQVRVEEDNPNKIRRTRRTRRSRDEE